MAGAESAIDMQQYWANSSRAYSYVPVKTFSDAFEKSHLGQSMAQQLETAYAKPKNAPDIDPLVRTR